MREQPPDKWIPDGDRGAVELRLAVHAGDVEAVQRLLRTYPDRGTTRRYAEAFGWDETTRGQLRVFEGVLGARGRG